MAKGEIEFLSSNWTRDTIARKQLANGQEATIIPLLFDRARITVGEPGARTYDDSW